MTISEDDLRGLSATERETLIAGEADDADGDIAQELGHAPRTAAAPAAAPAAPAGEAETDDDDEAAAAAAARAAAAPAPAAAPVPGDPAGEGEEDEEDNTPAPPERATPDDVDEQRKTLRTEKSEAMKRLLDGEIDQAAYQAIEDKVQDKLDLLMRAEASDQAREAIARDAMMSDYKAELNTTIMAAKAAGLDYKDPVIGKQFDGAVRMFSKHLSEQGIYDAPGNLANSKKAIAEAHAYVLRQNGKVATAAPAPAPTAAKPAATPRPAPDRSKLGVTLAGVPTAADASISSEFAHLDGISNPADLERELAKMSPDQQERYLGV